METQLLLSVLRCLSLRSRFSLWRSLRQRSSSNLCRNNTSQDRRASQRPKAEAPPPPSPSSQLRLLLPAPPPAPMPQPRLGLSIPTTATAETIQPSAEAPSWPARTAAWLPPRQTCGDSTRTVCCRRTPSPRPASTSQRGPSIRSKSSSRLNILRETEMLSRMSSNLCGAKLMLVDLLLLSASLLQVPVSVVQRHKTVF